MHHASSGELIDIRPLGDTLRQAVTKTLYKSDHMQVFRLVLLAGKTAPAHSVDGEITIQCVEGAVELSIGDVIRAMRPGDLVCLAGGVAHALKACEDASVLVTVQRQQH